MIPCGLIRVASTRTDIRDRWYGSIRVLRSLRHFLVDYNIGPPDLLLNLVQHFEQKKDLLENRFTSVEYLAETFEIAFFLIRLRCAQDHGKIGEVKSPLSCCGPYGP